MLINEGVTPPGLNPSRTDTIRYLAMLPTTNLSSGNYYYFIIINSVSVKTLDNSNEKFFEINYYKYDKSTNQVSLVFKRLKINDVAGVIFRIDSDANLFALINGTINKVTANGLMDITPPIKQIGNYSTVVANYEIFGNVLYAGLARTYLYVDTEQPQYELVKTDIK